MSRPAFIKFTDIEGLLCLLDIRDIHEISTDKKGNTVIRFKNNMGFKTVMNSVEDIAEILNKN